MPNDTALSANQTLFLSAGPTLSAQVYAVYGAVYLDPDSERNITFQLEFPEDYSTACIAEVLQCAKCSQYIPEDNCDTFMADNLNALAEVRLHLSSFIEVHDAFLYVHAQETFYGPNRTWPYETEIEYSCAPARSFSDGSGGVVPHVTLGCKWDKTWSPVDYLPPCECASN